MGNQFLTISNFQGYVTRPDSTNTNEKYLISGSQNVLINDAEKVSTREGYSLFGAANSATTPIRSKFDWVDSSGNTRNLRLYDDELEVYVGTVEGFAFNSWEKLKDGWTTTILMRFKPVWSATEVIDELLFVAQDANLYEWSGGQTTFASATAATITKRGTTTWAQERFLTAGTRQIRMKDSGGTWRTFTYTGGESTTTLTGVTPDPTAFTFSVDALVMQEVRTNSNQPASGLTNDIIGILANQVYIADSARRVIYISKNTSFTDYTNSSPRIAGEGAQLTLDDRPLAFAPLQDKMHISAGLDSWFNVTFEQLELSSGSRSESARIEKVKTGTNQAAQSQELVTVVGNSIIFVSHEPALRSLGEIENYTGVQFKALSNPIKPDFDAEDFSNGHIEFHRNRILISSPVNSKLYINEIVEDELGSVRRFWQPPQILPARCFMIRSGSLYFHSNSVAETYLAFDGTNDNTVSFNAKAVFAYRNFGDRVNKKSFDEYFTEGYIAANTVITVTYDYDFDGFTQSIERTIAGTDARILFEPVTEGSLGDSSLGDVSLGGGSETSSNPKFRIIHEIPPADFYELKVSYATDAVDYQFEILAHGPLVRLAPRKPYEIKQ